LDKLCEEWGADELLIKLHYLFGVRFVASELIAVKNFLRDLPAIVEVLNDELDMTDIPAEKSTKYMAGFEQSNNLSSSDT